MEVWEGAESRVSLCCLSKTTSTVSGGQAQNGEDTQSTCPSHHNACEHAFVPHTAFTLSAADSHIIPSRLAQTPKMLRQHFINTGAHDFTAFFALACWIYIILVSALQPPNPVATFVLCLGAVFLAMLVTCLDHQIRQLSQMQPSMAERGDVENIPGLERIDTPLPGAWVNIDERTRLLRPDGDSGSGTLPRAGPGWNGDWQYDPLKDVDKLVAISERLVKVRRTQEGIVAILCAHLSAAQIRLEEERKRHREVESNHNGAVDNNKNMEETLVVHPRVLIPPPDRPSSLQKGLRPTGLGKGALWDSNAA